MRIVDDEESLSSRMEEETAKWDRELKAMGNINIIGSSEEDGHRRGRSAELNHRKRAFPD